MVVKCMGRNRWKFEVGSHFFDRTLKKEHFEELLQNVPKNIRDKLWYLHDGAPAHHNVAFINI